MMPTMINDVPIACINQAAITYHIPATLIIAIMRKENGKNGQAVRNKNGSYDLGVMQINTTWLSTLARHGYTKNDIQFDACKNVMVATWLLAKGIAEGESVWHGVGNYHSHTPKYNQAYRKDIYSTYQKFNKAILS